MVPCNWELLPAEIRLIILESLGRDRTYRVGNRVLKKSLAGYACVSKEWREFFERENFRQLKLSQICLVEFGKIVHRQRPFVKHIWLYIQMCSYGSKRSMELEEDAKTESNQVTTRRAIWKLFTVLSTWGRGGDWGNRGLTLELSIYSPSDFKHVFGHYRYDADCESEPVEPSKTHDLPTDLPAPMMARLHALLSGINDPPPTWMEINRLFAPSLRLRSGRDLPKVDVVTNFLVRRQSRRQLEIVPAFSQVLRSLPRLENLHYETWRRFFRMKQEEEDIGMFLMLTKSRVNINTLQIMKP